MSKQEEYNEVCINEVIQLINQNKISISDFNKIESSVKNNYNYEREKPTINVDDVLDYVTWRLNHGERESIIEALTIQEAKDIKDQYGVNTLDGEYRFELLMKLFKLSSNELELESWIKPEILNKI
jgi:hypothetical protein